MVLSFENFLKVMWDEEIPGETVPSPQKVISQKHMNNAMTVKNIHQILPRGVNYEEKERKSAFRNL